MIDPWPTEAEAAERCQCGHMLGQHSYGADPSPCDECCCNGFEPSHVYGDAYLVARLSAARARRESL